MAATTTRPAAVSGARLLFLVNAVVRLAIGLASLARQAANDALPPAAALVIALLVLANSGAMALSAVVLGRRNRWAYLFALGVVALNILLTFTDQVGAVDLATLALDVILLGFLLDARGWYWPRTG